MFQSASPDPAALLRDLREKIARIERGGPIPSDATVPLGIAAIDTALPAGGLTRGALHEAMGSGPDTEHGAAATRFIASLLVRVDGPILWVLQRADLFAPGLAGAGLDPDRLIFVEAGKDVLAAMEEGLRHGGLGAVVGEVTGRLALVASRRLQLAAEQAGVLALVLRRTAVFDDPVLREPTAAMTRWRVTALPSGPALPHAPTTPGLGALRWRLDLLRCRGGEPGSWIVEVSDATGGLGLVPTVPDGSAASEWRRRA